MIIKQIINNKNMRILDIGCFDGRLLVELDRLITNADLWGFDINAQLEKYFPDNDNINFASTNLDDLEGQFDLIILSHSILYIPDIALLMASISKLLKSHGVLLIQIPDISNNIYYSLMGDQSFIFTETSLKNVLHNFGYRSEIVKNDYFPRELVVAAQMGKSVDLSNCKQDYLFQENIEKIHCVKAKLENINNQNLSVLGTTVNAAFVDEIIGKGVQFFVDENLSKIGETFRGKNVVHPKDLNDTNHTILPYGESGIKIQERFERLYRGTFTVV
jgi:SAM-dependent methyltransferase